MGAAAHLGIDLAEYDARIRTFIPDYEEMLVVGASALPRRARRIVDLGTGTGALAAKCLERLPRAALVAVDADADMLAVAAGRLVPISRARTPPAFLRGSFLRTALPRCDAVVASLALHHIRTHPAKQRLYQRIRSTLNPGGVLVSVDCQPPRDRVAAQAGFDAWMAHLRQKYSRREAEGYFRAWAKEDTYVPLEVEVQMLERAGFRVDVRWRRGVFAVLRAARS